MRKILILDDETAIVNLLNRFLKKNGFEVITSSSGKDTLGIIKDGEKIDLMIMDLKMPEMSGIDVLRELLKLKIKFPIFILTGSLDEGKYIEELTSMGFKEENFIHKPVDLSYLLELIKKKFKG